METIIQIIQSATSDFQNEDIQTPFRELGIDSIDLVSIRVEIEKYIGYEIPESKWYEFKSFQDVIHHVGQGRKKVVQPLEVINHTVNRELLIGMPQMANSALSENWLFKEMGDIHWELLCKGLNTESSLIKDESGNRLYATFTRVQTICSPLSRFKENQPLSVTGIIKRFGNLTYISKVQANSGQETITASLM